MNPEISSEERNKLIDVIRDYAEINQNGFAVFTPETLATPVVKKLTMQVKKCESKIRKEKRSKELNALYRKEKKKKDWKTTMEKIDASFKCYKLKR